MKDFVATTGFGQPDGLCGFNCRHSFFPFNPETDKPAYTKEQLRELNNKKVRLPSGEEVSVCDAELRQRALERELRELKAQKMMAEAVGLKKAAARANGKICAKQKELRTLCAATKLPRQYWREKR